MFPGAYDTAGPIARPLVDGALGILAPEVIALESAVDGAAIQMGIVRPDVPEGTRVPIIVDASPYYGPMTPEGIEANPKNDRVTFWTFDHYDYYVPSFVPHGYAVVFLATRGTADSGGCQNFFSPAEQADIDQAVTWLGEQPWSNGNVGMAGISYEGTAQWSVAGAGNPHLKTIVPIVGFPDIRHLLGRNGTVEGTVPGWFYTYGFVENSPTNGRSVAHTLEGVPCADLAREAAAYLTAFATGSFEDPLGYYDHWNMQPEAEANYQGSVFVVNGLRDHAAMWAYYPWIAALEERGLAVKHLLGDWGHGYPEIRIFDGDDATHKRWDFAEILLHWFDYWLKDDRSVDLDPGAQVQDTSGAWRDEPTWPPRDGWPVPFYLAASGLLVAAPAPEAGAASVGPSPAALGGAPCGVVGTAPLCALAEAAGALPCPGCTRFETEPLAGPLRFAGLPTLHLTATPGGPSGSFAAELLLLAGGAERVLGAATIDLRYAAGDGSASPVVPGRPVVARLQFDPMDVVVPAGGKLALTIRQATYQPGLPIEVALGGEASVLTVMAFERGSEVFFVPPGAAT